MLTLLVCVLWSILGDGDMFCKTTGFFITSGNAIVNVHLAASFSKLNLKTENHFNHK